MNLSQLNEIFSYIDLVPGEVKVYLALLKKKNCSPSEIAKISGLKRTKVYDLLTSLEKKGACILLQSTQKMYEPVEPALLMEKVKKRLSLAASGISEASEELSNLYYNSHDANEIVDYVEVISDPILVLKKFNSLIKLSNEEILISSAGESVAVKLSKKDKELAERLNDESDRLIENALQKNVIIKIIVGLNDLNTGMIDELNMKLFEYDNYDIRIIENIPCKQALFDGKHIAIGLRGIRTAKYISSTIYLRDKGLGNFNRKSFYSYWAEGISIKKIDLDVLVSERKIKVL
ncbi:MAG: hypothetical protein K8S62_07520 [Candidatus Sabulitectum sp.]|nr:hypothetical protein [Candidatus Sabulitectum sp.]